MPSIALVEANQDKGRYPAPPFCRPRMNVGTPREIKTHENRVAMVPSGVLELTQAGHGVLVEQGAGLGSGIADEEFARAGATLVKTPEEVFEKSDLIVKVKEPLPPEYKRIRKGQTVFTYFHFAADEKLTQAVMRSGITAIAYETIKDFHLLDHDLSQETGELTPTLKVKRNVVHDKFADVVDRVYDTPR